MVMSMSEIWRPVPQFEGFYEVSSLGRVKRLDTTLTHRNRWGMISRVKRGKILTPVKHRNGHLRVSWPGLRSA